MHNDNTLRRTALKSISNIWSSVASRIPVQGQFERDALRIFHESRPGLELIEDRILAVLNSEAALLSTISRHLLKQGGKRIRPLLALSTARLFGQTTPCAELIEAAAGIELIHMATLIHDDIIDGSPTRRHQTSAFLEFGLGPSLLTGDFLLVKAFGMCARLERFIIEETEKACIALTEGEVLEGKLGFDQRKNLDDYLNIVGKKTASLFSLSCGVGARLAKASDDTVAKLMRFGNFAGISFQMVDDILDVTADEDLLGKPVGSDLRERTPSLVNILWLASANDDAIAFFSKPNISDRDTQNAVLRIRRSDIVPQCRGLAQEYAEKALDELNSIDQPNLVEDVRAGLAGLVEYTLHRCL